MSNGLPHLRKKVAKGRAYYYFDAGKDERGQRVLTKLPDIKDPRFGDCYARAKAERSKHKDNRGVLTLDGLIRSYEKSPEFRGLAESSRYNYSLYLGVANRFMRNKNGFSAPAHTIRRSDIQAIRERLADTPGAANAAMRALGALFAWAIDNEKLKGENPPKAKSRWRLRPRSRRKRTRQACPQKGRPSLGPVAIVQRQPMFIVEDAKRVKKFGLIQLPSGTNLRSPEGGGAIWKVYSTWASCLMAASSQPRTIRLSSVFAQIAKMPCSTKCAGISALGLA